MAPANPPPKSPLEMLQILVDDVLVQAGKALRNARQDGPGKAGSTHLSMKAKLPETIARFHAALDDLEGDIIRAKSTLLRDLESERAKTEAPKQAQPTPTPSVSQSKAEQLPQPQPVESQSKEPMVIDLESSPPPESQPASVPDQKDVKPRAPFPDMGTGASSSLNSTPMVKEESTSSLKIKRSDSPSKRDVKAAVKSENTAQPAPMAPMPTMDVDMSNSNNSAGDVPAAQMTDDDFNFTDMQFSLAPPSSDLQPTGADGGSANDMLSLDNIFPAETKGTDNNDTKAEQSGDGYQGTAEDPADGMDFDFGLGDDEFNSYMDARDDNLDLGSNDFNGSFFNLDGTDDA